MGASFFSAEMTIEWPVILRVIDRATFDRVCESKYALEGGSGDEVTRFEVGVSSS